MADYSIISENDKQFAGEFSRFVNGKMSSAKKTGIELANDHRFLVQEKFKVAMFFIEQLAANYQRAIMTHVMNGLASWQMKLSSILVRKNFIIQPFKVMNYGKLGKNRLSY